MFETLFDAADVLARHRDGPFAEDRERFLEQRGREGFSLDELRKYARMLLWIAGELDASPGRSLTVEQIRSAAARWWRFRRRYELRPSRKTHPRLAFIKLAVSWFRFLGRFSEAPKVSDPFAEVLRDFTAWMEDERGLAATTVTSRLVIARRFLKWYDALGRSFAAVRLIDIDAYLNVCAQKGWSRSTIATEVGMLRAFFQHSGASMRAPPFALPVSRTSTCGAAPGLRRVRETHRQVARRE